VGTDNDEEPQKEKKGRGMKILKKVGETLKNPRNLVRGPLLALSIAMPAVGLPVSAGVSMALSARPASAQELRSSSVSASADARKATLPTFEEVEQAGRKPYLRYTMPEGKLILKPMSGLQQPEYNKKNKAAIEALPRAYASKVGLVGAHALNEVSSMYAVEVILSDDAVVIYRQTSQGIDPLYLADCDWHGTPKANRIQLVPVPQKPTSQTLPTPQPMTQVTVPPTVVMNPPFPSALSLGVNLTGLPQPFVLEQHTYVHRDVFQKMESVGKTAAYVGATYLEFKLPGAIENAGSRRVPDQITNTNINNNINPGSGVRPPKLPKPRPPAPKPFKLSKDHNHDGDKDRDKDHQKGDHNKDRHDDGGKKDHRDGDDKDRRDSENRGDKDRSDGHDDHDGGYNRD
jgi:hypothetical protein